MVVLKKMWVLLFLNFFFFTVQAQNESLLLLNPQQLKQDFQILRTALEKTHAGLYTYTSQNELNLAFEKIEKSLNEPMTSIVFFRKISKLLKLIGNGHTKFLPSPNFMKAINGTLPRFPFAMYLDKDEMYVLRNVSNDKEIQPGTIIKSINGKKASDVVQEMIDHISRDGNNTSFPKEKLNFDFSKYYAIFIETPKVFNLEIVDTEGKEKEIQVEGLTSTEILKHSKERYPNLKKKSNSKPLVFTIKDGIGLLTITSFDKQGIKKEGQKYKDFFNETFAQIKNAKLKNLIIDVRDNGGGWPEVVVDLHRYLSDQPFEPNVFSHTITKNLPNRKHYRYGFWEYLELRFSLRLKKKGEIYQVNRKSKTKSFPPAEDIFTGDLYVLINPFSLSATCSFLGMLKNDDRGIFIGETAGGSPHQTTSWIMPSLILPHSKIEAIVPLVHMKSKMKYEDTKDGIAPHHFVKNSIEDMINKRDAVMEFTLEQIRNKN